MQFAVLVIEPLERPADADRYPGAWAFMSARALVQRKTTKAFIVDADSAKDAEYRVKQHLRTFGRKKDSVKGAVPTEHLPTHVCATVAREPKRRLSRLGGVSYGRYVEQWNKRSID
jgi:hypothetical protein